MSFLRSSITFLVALLAASTLATPIDGFFMDRPMDFPVDAPAGFAKRAALEKRDTAVVYACEHSNFGGTCTDMVGITGYCHDVPSGFNDMISSVYIIAPEWDRCFCRLFQHSGCAGDLYTWQGQDESLTEFNDRASSWACWMIG